MIDALEKLSGMSYRGGMYTPEQWEQKTGVNPERLPPGLVTITAKYRFCTLTDKSERILSGHFADVQSLARMLADKHGETNHKGIKWQ